MLQCDLRYLPAPPGIFGSHEPHARPPAVPARLDRRRRAAAAGRPAGFNGAGRAGATPSDVLIRAGVRDSDGLDAGGPGRWRSVRAAVVCGGALRATMHTVELAARPGQGARARRAHVAGTEVFTIFIVTEERS